MFIGHFAIALGAKKYAPAVSLGALFLACQLADLVWPNLVLLGIESFAIEPGATVLTPLDFQHYPYSHSLVALLLWAVLFGALYAVLAGGGTRAALVLAIVVVSHWVLDVLSHRPDMPVWFGTSAKIGLGLWNNPVLAIGLELGLFGAGVWLYVRQTRPLDRSGSTGFWTLIVFLLGIHAANLLGPPPPSTGAVTWSAQAMWLLVAWAYWVDRHRAPRAAA